MRFSVDAAGKEMLVLDDGLSPTTGENVVVMMEWERPYMRACVEALAIVSSDDVLEIGFGCGYSANHIQSFSPRSHVIIECDQVVLDKAHKWAEGKKGVIIVEGIWQERLHDLDIFDAIFFDDFPVPEAGALIATSGIRENDSRWHTFVDLCVNLHMRPGGRITGYLARHLDLQRQDCSFDVKRFAVSPPVDCPYFTDKFLLIPLIRYMAGNRAAVAVLEVDTKHNPDDTNDETELPKRDQLSGRSMETGASTATAAPRPWKRSKLCLPGPRVPEPTGAETGAENDVKV